MNAEEERLKIFNSISKVPKYYLIEMLQQLKNEGYVSDFDRNSTRYELAKFLASVIVNFGLTHKYQEILKYNGYTSRVLPKRVSAYLKDLIYRDYTPAEAREELEKLRYYGILDVILQPLDRYQVIDLLVETAPIVQNLIPDKFPKLMLLLMKAEGIVKYPLENIEQAQRYLEGINMNDLRDILRELTKSNNVVYSPGRTKKGLATDIIDHLLVDKNIPQNEILLNAVQLIEGKRTLPTITNNPMRNIAQYGSLPPPQPIPSNTRNARKLINITPRYYYY